MILERFEKFEARSKELENLLADPLVLADKSKYQAYAKELSDPSQLLRPYREYLSAQKEIEKLEREKMQHKADKEFTALIEEELGQLKQKSEKFHAQLEKIVAEQDEDPDANRNVIMEIRAGTGGEEAGIFAGDLYRMYTKYADKMGWSVEVMDSRQSQLNGFKEVILAIKGSKVYSKLKFESGVHRVQRVPETEASGRIHTSAATVAVLPEAEEVEVEIDPKDLRIDVFRATGPGGQGVNTTDSAVRITHIPTGLVVNCQDERSQLKNKNKAMRVLRARLLDDLRMKQEQKISNERKSMVKSGDRSDKIRTYNFPERRVTDHRIGFTIYKLDNFLEGEIDEMIEALRKAENDLKQGINVKK